MPVKPNNRRALLISSPFGGLIGPENDLKSMISIAERRQFDIVSIGGHQGTRDNILAA
jgi:hypothetical protein